MLSNQQPKTLADIVGQPPVRILQRYVQIPPDERPSRCYLLEGAPGVGKSQTAACLAHELDCDRNSLDSGYLRLIAASDLKIEDVKTLFTQTLRYSYPWKLIIIEELDGLPSKAVERFLKTYMDEHRLPPRTTVIATSNGAGNLDPAFLQRFRILHFGNGPSFAAACQDRLGEIWSAENGDGCLPAGWLSWGATDEGFSMRRAMQALEDALMMREAVAA